MQCPLLTRLPVSVLICGCWFLIFKYIPAVSDFKPVPQHSSENEGSPFPSAYIVFRRCRKKHENNGNYPCPRENITGPIVTRQIPVMKIQGIIGIIITILFGLCSSCLHSGTVFLNWKQVFSVPMRATEHNFLRTPTWSLLMSPRTACDSRCVVKHLPGDWAFSCLRGCKAFVSQTCATCKKHSPTDTLINALFYSKINLGLKFRERKFLSVWLLAGGIKFTWLPWQDPQQGNSAAHPCKQVLNFCPRGSGLIAWKGHTHREIRTALSSPSQEPGCFPGMAVAEGH